MSNRVERPPHISQEAWDAVDVPELTDAEFARARPFAELFPHASQELRKRGGRPKMDRPRVKVGWRLAADVVDAVQGTGKGYTGRVEAILRQAMADGRL